jgi:hypothetical protein
MVLPVNLTSYLQSLFESLLCDNVLIATSAGAALCIQEMREQNCLRASRRTYTMSITFRAFS